MGSEVGMVEIEELKVIEKGKLGPGEIIAVDLVNKKILKNNEIKEKYSKLHPYREWVKNVVGVDISSALLLIMKSTLW